MKNICFVCNFDKTPVFMAIASVLKEHGVEVYWITTNYGYYKELVMSYPVDKILYINRDFASYNNKPVGSFRINEIVYGDRILKDQPELGYNFLVNIQKPIYDFIFNNKIRVVYGEVTHSYEVLMCRMCNQLKELSCLYLSTSTTRIPDDALFFSTDEKNNVVLEMEEPIGENLGANDFVVKAPAYLEGNNKLLAEQTSARGLFTSLINFITGRNVESKDPSVYKNRMTHFRIKTKSIWNYYTYRFLKKHGVSILEGKKYVLYGFHVQPESSIDICGRYYENQYQNVINIWRSLPDDWFLVIKEHSSGVGNRSYSMLKSLTKLRNVILLDEKVSAVEVMKTAQAVFTVTGTMALEAALQGVPSITLAPNWFNMLNHCNHLSWEDLENIDLQTYCSEIRKRPINKDEYMAFVKKNSFKGEMYGIEFRMSVLDNSNLKSICAAFLHVLKD